MDVRFTSPTPNVLTLRDGTTLTVRPLAGSDAAALSAFMAALPAADRYFMKDDVTDTTTIASWVKNAGRGSSLALLALDGDRVVADAALIRHRGEFRAHHAEVRVSIVPEYRGKGLGTALVRKLAEVAWEADMQFLDFELVAGPQDTAIEAMRSIGAYPVGTLQGFVQDQSGEARDMVFLRLPLGQWFTY
ncbi:MAG: N-acetyltransferase family protein [Dehalococcoidia bacterium]